MPTNTDVLDKLKADLASRSGRSTTNAPVKLQYSGMMDMSWAKDRVDFANYDIKGTDIYDVDRYGNTSLKWENYKGATGNENRLALQQGWGEKATNGVTKFLGKTGLIAADALATVTYGLGSAISQGSLSAMWDNELSKSLDDQSKKMDKSFAHYYSDEEKAKSLFGQALTANFWFNDVGNGLAFVAGTVLSEVPLAILTGGGSVTVGMAKAGARLGLKGLAKSADNIAANVVRNSADDIINTTAKQAVRSEGTAALRDINRRSIKHFTTATAFGGTVGEVFKTARFLGQSVAFEAGMEARHSFTDAVDKYVNTYKLRYGELPSAEDLGAFMEDAKSTANGVFAANAALLSVTNFAMFSKFFDLKMVKMPNLGVSDKILGRSVTTLEDGSKLFTRGNKAQRALGTVINVAKPVASEGFLEEGMQGVFGNTMEKYLDAKYDPRSADSHSLVDAFTESLVEQYTTKDGLKEVFIGGIIGLLGGNVGAAISKPATALGVKGMEGGSFGVTGLGKDGYGAQLNAIDNSVKEYNKTVEKFRDLNRASSIGSFRTNKQTGSEQFTILEDSVTNYNFIKSNESLKGYADTVADFEASVNALEFTKEQMTEYGFDNLDEVSDYKNSIIEGFKTDYTNYKKANKTVEALGINDQTLPDGSKIELKDATTLAIMQGLKAGNIVNTIGDNISQLTGEQGAYSTLKFYKEVEKENGQKLQELKDLGQQISDLTTNIAEVGAQMQEVQGNEVLAKELSKKHVTLSKQLLEGTDRQNALQKALDANLQTIAQDGNAAGVTSINELVERYDKINNYVSTLKSTGKTKDANDLGFLMGQFDSYLALEANSKDTIQRMANTNFYSSKEGKSFLDRILGKPYSMSEEARKEIRDNEEVLNPILEKLGYKGEDLIKELEKALTENTELSDREKFKIESMIRAKFAYNAIQESIEKTQDSVDGVIAVETEQGDTLAQRVSNVSAGLNNIEEINNLIKEISGEIDIITNKPTAENLKKIRENQKRIEALQKEIADIESGVVQPSQVEDTKTNTKEEGKVNVKDLKAGDKFTHNGKEYTVKYLNEDIGGRVNNIETEEGRVITNPNVILKTNSEWTLNISEEQITSPESRQSGEITESSNQLGEIEDSEYNDFVDNGEVSEERLSDIANKVKNQEELSERENAIFTDKTAEINNLIVANEQQTETNTGEQADTNRDAESTANEQGESRATIEQVNTQSKEQAIAERVAEIDTIEAESAELKIPFKFMESEGYKRYLKLLNKRLKTGNLTPTEEDEFNIAEKRVNQWISILGASNGQLELTDLIKQLVALENAQIEFTPDVTEVLDEEIAEDAGLANKYQNRNRTVGLNYEVAVTQEVIVDGVVRTSVHNLTLDAFKDLAGVEIQDSDVVVNHITESFTINRELVDKINEAGNIRIMSVSIDEASTYYSTIRQASVNMKGETVYTPLASDYYNSNIKRKDVYDTKEGEELRLSVDPTTSWNEKIIALIKAENSDRAFSEKERATQVDLELQKLINKSKTITNLQFEINRLNNSPKTTDNKAKLNKATKTVNDLVAKLKEQAEDKVEKRNSSDAKIKISKELRDKIATEINIVLVNSDEVSVQTLKGTKTNSESSYEGDEAKFFALRRQLANDDVFLMQLMDNNNQTPSNYTVKVEKVFPGLPNFNTKLSDGVIIRESKVITEQGVGVVSDIGYVKDGKLQTKNKSKNVDGTFINTVKISNRSSKTPVVIIKQGEKLIAFPVRVARNESPISLDEFRSVFYNEDIDNTEKAIRLNTILATAGIDVKQKGNAFIDLGNGLQTELFDNLFAQLEQKEYLSEVDSWIDPTTDIKETLVDRVSISLDMSKPFVNPKIKLDSNSIDIEVEENEVNKEAKEKSAISSAKSTVSAIAGVKKYKFCE